jgi:hypothetical protein
LNPDAPGCGRRGTHWAAVSLDRWTRNTKARGARFQKTFGNIGCHAVLFVRVGAAAARTAHGRRVEIEAACHCDRAGATNLKDGADNSTVTVTVTVTFNASAS